VRVRRRVLFHRDIPDGRWRSVARRRSRGVPPSIKISEGPGTIWPSTPDPRPLRLLVGEPFSRAFMPARPGAVQRPVGGRVGGAGCGSGVRLPALRAANLCVPSVRPRAGVLRGELRRAQSAGVFAGSPRTLPKDSARRALTRGPATAIPGTVCGVGGRESQNSDGSGFRGGMPRRHSGDP
jgi:hypothetical protein